MAFNVDEFYALPVKIAFGRNRQDEHFRNWDGSFGDLIAARFAGVPVGQKDGACMTQSATTGGRRRAQTMVGPTILMVDHDTGETMDEVAALYEGAGLYALLWNTHSHMTTESDVGEGGLTNFLRKDPTWKTLGLTSPAIEDPSVLLAQVRDYFATKRYVPDLLNSFHDVRRDVTDGAKYIITHAPMHKLRSMLVLEKPFLLLEGGTQKDRIDEWKERYAGFCVKLGVPYDRSCVDPSRLMYLPRRPAGSDEGDFEIREIEGRTVTLDDMPRYKANTKQLDAFAQAAKELGTSTSEGKQRNFITKNLRRFMAQGGSSFAIAEWLREVEPEIRNEHDNKLTICCPNDDHHSNPGDHKDQGFWVKNAQDNDEGAGFSASCSHDTCRGMSDSDRAWYLDQLCVKYDVADAMELREFCDDWKESDDDPVQPEKAAEDEAAFAEALASLPPDASPAAVLGIVRVIALGANGLYEDRRIDAIMEKVGGLRRPTLVKEVKKAREQIAQEAAGGNNSALPPGDAHPVPDEPENATVIWSTWGYDDKIECAKARFIKVNAKDPELFVRPEGGTVRLKEVGDNLIFEEMAAPPKWVDALASRMRFVRPDEMDATVGISAPPFPEVVTALMGDGKLLLPVVERIVEVPVFGPEGTLRTTKGYDAPSKTYLNPTIEFMPVPDEVSADHVYDAAMLLMEAVRDFPFSDSFTGADQKPVRVKNEDGSWADCDQDGHPWPNFERGMASRANFYAMMLQPFARSMIDGPCPAYLIDKSMPGTGAGFLADVAGVVLNGTRMVPQTIPGDGDEFRKEMASVLREGATTVFFDNMTTKIDSGALASALTAGVWKSRILGQSASFSIPIKATWIFAANNGRFSDELMRRLVPIRMDAATANPSRDRSASWYKHKDLHGWLLENRAQLVWACHILIRNWVQAGRPPGSATLQSFNSWSRTMSGILEAAGIEGFMENVNAYLDGREEDGAGATPLVQKLFDFHQHEWFDMEGALTAIKNRMTGEIEPGLGVDLDTRNDQRMRQSFGYALSGIVGKVYAVEGGQIQVEKRKNNRMEYRLIRP